MSSLRSVAVLRNSPRATTDEEVDADSGWRGVCETPGETPTSMAISAGKAAFSRSGTQPDSVQWLLHSGAGPQAGAGWPVHHHVQSAVVGDHGNALEVKQNCAGGVATWLLASKLVDVNGVNVCTGADNWSWTDRFAVSRTGGEPFSDVAHATVVAGQGGFAKMLGAGTASHPPAADGWRSPSGFWESTSAESFSSIYDRASEEVSLETVRRSALMMRRAIGSALADAKISPQYVTHLVIPGSDDGQPYLTLAKLMGLPWSADLHEHSVSHGYLGVSEQAEGLVRLAEQGMLQRDSIVLVLGCGYTIDATAIVYRITHRPNILSEGAIRVIW